MYDRIVHVLLSTENSRYEPDPEGEGSASCYAIAGADPEIVQGGG